MESAVLHLPLTLAGHVPNPSSDEWEWRWSDLLAAGPALPFAWHSDAPVMTMGPLLHLYCMVTPYEVDRDDVSIL